MTPEEFICAARVPHSLRPQSFGPWRIDRINGDQLWKPHLNFVQAFEVARDRARIGFPDYTLLLRHSWATIHQKNPEVVMEDSQQELRKHLPIWLNASGHVLVTGLGLGCVVRGLLASPRVTHVTVVEISQEILRVVGHEFRGNPRVTLRLGDALKIHLRDTFDYAWHDLWTDGSVGLQVQHAQLLCRFRKQCGPQGAWDFPRFMKKSFGKRLPLIG